MKTLVSLSLCLLASLILTGVPSRALAGPGAVFRVETFDDELAGDGRLSLREAVKAANTDKPVDGSPAGGVRDTILLPPGVYSLKRDGAQEDGNACGDLDLRGSIIIKSEAGAGAVIDGQGLDRVIHVHPGCEAELRWLTIRGGCAAGPKEARRFAPRTVGGTEAEPGAWPMMAALVHSEIEDAYAGFFCGGALIHPGWVLSTAHCMEGLSAGEVDAVLGRHDLTAAAGERIAVAEIIVHPLFDRFTLDYDFALLRLAEASSQAPGVLIEPDDPGGLTAPGAPVTVLGWGDTMDPEPWTFPERLRQVEMEIISSGDANAAYEPLHGPGAVTESMLAAGAEGGGKDACAGDSGGPLLIYDDALERWIQAGVTSWGAENCGDPLYPGIYARVAAARDWIDASVEPLTAAGGGILNEGSLTAAGCTVSGNAAACGGAVYNKGVLRMLNCTLSGNAAGQGGGLYNMGAGRMVFCTVAGNEAGEGGGIYGAPCNSTAVKNSLVARNRTEGEGADVYGEIASAGFNLFGASGGGSGFYPNDLLDAGPSLEPLADNGGPAFTHALAPGSPAINAAVITDLSGAPVPDDQRGVSRPQGDAPDIGAYELEVPPPDPRFVINEIHAAPHPEKGDANGDGTAHPAEDEFIEFFNLTGEAVDISGWTVSGGEAIRHVFPEGTEIKNRQAATVFGGGALEGDFGLAVVQTASSGLLSLGDGGGRVILQDTGGKEIAAYTYGAEAGRSQSLSRQPDLFGPEPLRAHSLLAGSGGRLFSPGRKLAELYFPDSAEVADGWRGADWLGWFYSDHFPYIWHKAHGWWYCAGPGGGSLWIWEGEPGPGWMWTGPRTYPFFYGAAAGGWLYYLPDSARPRFFFNYKSGAWASVP